MRFLMTVTCPAEPFNTAVRKGTASEIISHALETIKPEAVYFTSLKGQRTALLIVNMNDTSAIPALAEPWFLSFNADVTFNPVMTVDDLRKSDLATVGKKWPATT